jgi:hypothetical protein
MIGVMVDDRAMRFRQQGTSPAPGQPRSLSSFSQPVVQPRQPRPTPQPVAAQRPVEPTPSPTNRFENLLRAVNPLARRNDVSSSLMGPTATTLANANAPFTTGAIAERGSAGLGDVAKDLGTYAVGGALGRLAGAGINAGVRAASPYLRRAAYASNSPVVRDTLMGRHFGPANLSVIHPRDVPIVDARTIGPGTYFTNTDRAADSLRLRLPGDRSNEYGVPLSFMDRYKLASSQGYAGPDDVARAVSDLGLEGNLPLSQSRVPLNEAGFDNPIVQNLLNRGFVGFNQGKGGFPTGEFTNWLVGADDIARINSRLPQLGLQSGPADVNSIPRLESILRRFFPEQ